MIALLIHSGDKASWVWEHWYRYFSKHWNGYDKIPAYFISETIVTKFKNIDSILTGNVPWSNGLIDILDNKLPKDITHFIYTHEDYFLLGNPNFNKIFELYKLMVNNNINLIKICGPDAGVDLGANPKILHDTEFKELKQYDDSLTCKISLQPSIWNRNFFRSVLRPNETGRQHEKFGNERSKNIKVYAYIQEIIYPYIETITAGQPYVGRERYFNGTCS